ncbi:MAG: di-heme oxidoredictase family protein [Myxococcales bacterium]|nr:thiol oxidoreductase [Myxococcota bacterium]MDW8284284.1 di-heme oxidoredictase family protein [Myxococcales bacterium]
MFPHRSFRCAALACTLLASCDALLSSLPPEDEILEGPIEGLNGAQLRSFLAGDEAFRDLFTPARGLGPIFNAPSCDSCHPGDGKGHPAFNLTRFGRGDPDNAARFDPLVHLGGPQLQDRAIPGYLPEVLPPDVVTSVRSGPAVAGLGLVEAIPEETLLALADPDDRDGDGISGRPNYVPVPDFLPLPPGCSCPGCQKRAEGCLRLGRFGRKATAIDLVHQTVNAYLHDMGLTTPQLLQDPYNPLVGSGSGDAVPDPEVPSSTVSQVVFYLRTIRPPSRRQADDPEVVRGQQVFVQIGCAACHVPELRSGWSPIAPLSDRPVPLYSDLLLHDMGEQLADQYPEGEATGREWRTTPLWGLGLIPHLLGGQAFYLHDGRARTLPEAIQLHGGEARRSAERFAQLPPPEREALLRFLQSL